MLITAAIVSEISPCIRRVYMNYVRVQGVWAIVKSDPEVNSIDLN